MKHKIEYLKLNSISNDQRFNLNSAFGFKILKDSIVSIGIIYPLLAWKNQGFIILIDGFKRLEIAKSIGITELPFILMSGNLGFEEIIKIRYYNIKQEDAELNAHQKLSILMMLKEADQADQIIKNWQKILNLFNPEKYLNILNWPKIALDYIYNYNVSIKQLQYIIGQSSEVITEIFLLATSLSIRIVELSTIVEILSEIALNEKVSIISILNREQIHSLMENRDLNRNQKILKLKKILNEWRYPTIIKYQKQLDDQLKKLSFNENTQILYDKTFEKSNIILSVRLRNSEDLDNFVNLITDKSNKLTLKAILSSL